MTKVATVIIENSKGKILAYLRDNKPEIPFPNHWDLFGGQVEEGENPEEAAIREIKEELNIEIKDLKFFKTYDCKEGDIRPNIKYVYSTNLGKPIENLTLMEGQKLQYFSPNEIPSVKFANILKKIILDYLKSK